MKSIAEEQTARYQERLEDAEHLFFVFPPWWESMSAATKGFLDEVMTKCDLYSGSKPRASVRERPAGASWGDAHERDDDTGFFGSLAFR
jgi:putative NADPH-quinone reductase